MKLSIIIPTILRDPQKTITLLNALPPHEVILVDNRTSPQASDFPAHVKHIPFPTPFSYSKVCNEGAKHATGDILLFLNDDIVFEKGAIETLLSNMTPEISMLSCQWRDSKYASYSACVSLRLEGSGVQVVQYTEYPDLLGGPCLMIWKNIFNKIGGFDEDFHITHSENVLSLQASKFGPLRVIPDVLFVHDERTSRGPLDDPKDTEIFFKKYSREILKSSKISSSVDIYRSTTVKADKLLLIKPDHIGDMAIFMSLLPHITAKYPNSEIHIAANNTGIKMLQESYWPPSRLHKLNILSDGGVASSPLPVNPMEIVNLNSQKFDFALYFRNDYLNFTHFLEFPLHRMQSESTYSNMFLFLVEAPHPGGGLPQEIKTIVVSDLCSHSIKSYPRMQDLVSSLLKFGFNIVIGGEGKLSKEFPTLETISAPTVTQYAREVISIADLYIGYDTGPTHMVALESNGDMPILQIFSGLVLKKDYCARAKNLIALSHKVPCSPCRNLQCQNNQSCLSNLSVSDILSAIGEFL